jgi:predicted AAA+ superfamily ATPase
MFERKRMQSLIAWKKDPDRKPLLLHGARQVGKTHLVHAFADECYQDLALFDFEARPDIAALFEGDITPGAVIPELELRLRRKIIPGQTLIFFDEVQRQGRALTALKYFNEQASEHHVIAAGSLLGIAIAREKVMFPVGNVNHCVLNPLDFEEFLWAAKEKMLADAIRQHTYDMEPLSLHAEALRLYRIYLVCGGMPAALLAYFKDNDLHAPRRIHRDIEKDHAFDIVKYADSEESARILDTLRSIPAQLAKENHKFQYSVISKGARASRFRYPLMWLDAARIINRCQHVDEGFSPVKASEDDDGFKVYMADTGMLSTSFGVDPLAVYDDAVASSAFKGALAENFVMQQLVSQKLDVHYWGKHGRAEVDFLYTDSQGNAVPVELKSSDNVRSRSLAAFREKYAPAYSVRFSTKNFGESNQIKSLPLYAAFCVKSALGANL